MRVTHFNNQSDSTFTCFDLDKKAKPTSRLFCFPYAGGSGVNFKTWHRHIPSRVEVLALTIPGRGSLYHSPAFTEMEPLIDSVLKAILPYAVEGLGPMIDIANSAGRGF